MKTHPNAANWDIRLTTGQIRVFRYIKDHPGLTAAEIAAGIERRVPVVTTWLLMLDGLGRVRHHPDTNTWIAVEGAPE